MINQINQIQASYSVGEDRILLDLKCSSKQVYFAWFTRRFLKLLLPALHGIHPVTGKALFDDPMTMGLTESNSPDLQIKGSVISGDKLAEHQNDSQNTIPILLTKITLRDLNSEQAQLCLTAESLQSTQLCFHSDVLSILLKTLEQAAQEAEWGLEAETLLQIPATRVH